MIQLLLRRLPGISTERYTCGVLYCNGVTVCHTLEPCDRGLTADMSYTDITRCKVPGQTAIPTGRYWVRLLKSPKFSGRTFYKNLGGLLPTVQGVKGFTGILIHCGNTVSDTSGCILVGRRIGAGVIGDSRKMYRRLYSLLSPSLLNDDKIYLSVERYDD